MSERIDVAYCRVSSDSGQDSALQRETLEPWLEEMGVQPTWLEETHSGRKMDAPNLKLLRAWVQQGLVRTIYVWSYNRLGRNTRLGCEFVEMCIENGTDVKSKLEGYDLNTPEGMAAFQRQMVDSELSLKHLSVNTRLGLDRAKRTCRHCRKVQAKGGPPPCECFEPRFRGGYTRRWTSEKVMAKLPKIRTLLAKGVPYCDIARAVQCDERTVAKIAKEGNALPTARPRVWDQ